MIKETRKIMGGKVYNTETAEQIADYSNGLGPSDFNNFLERLYRTQKGAWFLVGEGGANTKYCQAAGNNSTIGGSRWEVLNDNDVFQWLQRRGETEALEKYFGDRLEEA